MGIGVSRSFKYGFLQIADEGSKDPFACSLFNELNSYPRVLFLACHGGSVGNLYTNLDAWSFRVWVLFIFCVCGKEDLFIYLFCCFVCLLILNGATSFSPQVPQRKKLP